LIGKTKKLEQHRTLLSLYEENGTYKKKYPKLEEINSYVKTTFLNSTEWRGEGANCRACPLGSPSRRVPQGPF
jgi:hypothetical protein